MAKRELKHRLDELFSHPTSPQPPEPPSAEGAAAPPPPPAPLPAAAVPRTPDSVARALLDSLPDAVAVFDRATKRFLDCNRTLLARYGYTLDELRGMTLHQLHPPEEAELVDRRFNDRVGFASQVYTHVTRRGDRLLVEIRTAECNYDSRPAWIGSIRDVTDRRQVELDMIRRNQDLETVNQVSQSLSSISNQDEVLDLVHSIFGQMLDTNNLYVTVYDAVNQRLAFPLNVVDGAHVPLPKRASGNEIPDYVIRTRMPLLPGNVESDLKQLGITLPDRMPRSLLAVPMIVGAKVVGAIVAQDYERANVFRHAHIEPLVLAASQVGAALENTRLLADVGRRAVQLQTASAVSRAASSILNLDELLPATAELIRNRFDLYYVGIFLVDAAKEFAVLRAGTGEAGRTMLESGHRLAVNGNSMIGWCVANQRARVALDVGAEAVRFDNPILPDTRSEVALPLIERGETIGAMSVQSTLEAAFGEVDIAVLQTMADQVANAIGNARLLEQTQKRIAELATINSINQALGSHLELSGLLELVVERLRQFFGVSDAYLALYDAQTNLIEIPYLVTSGQRMSILSYPLGGGFTSYIIRTRQPLIINRDMMQRAEELSAQLAGEPSKSYLGVPIIARDEVIGVLAVQNMEREEAFGDLEVRLMSTIAPSVGVAIQNARLFAQTQEALAESRQRARREELTNRIAGRIRAAVSVEEALRIAAEELRQATGAPRSTVRLTGPARVADNGYKHDQR